MVNSLNVSVFCLLLQVRHTFVAHQVPLFSQELKYRTVRIATCMQETKDVTFLIKVSILRDETTVYDLIYLIRILSVFLTERAGRGFRFLRGLNLINWFNKTQCVKIRCRDSVVGILARLRTGRPTVRTWAWIRTTWPSLQPAQPPMQWAPWLFPGGKSVGMRSWPHQHLVQRLRINWAVLLLPLYAFKARTGITLHIHFWDAQYVCDTPSNMCMGYVVIIAGTNICGLKYITQR